MINKEALLAASLCAAASLALIWKWQKNRRPPYPPGPKGYPLIGNILDIPQDIPAWKAFIALAQKFGVFAPPSPETVRLRFYRFKIRMCYISSY